MGGSAFADENPTISTPRMPTAVYHHVRDHLLSTLRTLYVRAECPIETPGKTDYGDIDILVADPVADIDADRLSAIIGAVKHKKTANSPTTHFAVPWPQLPQHPSSSEASPATETSTAGSNANGGRYIQLDLHLCTSASFPWELFHNAHGDFWNILGSTIRPLGLTPSNTGLYIRIHELEARNKTAARILLTTSPAETLKYLGLDESLYWQKFASVDELFAYAASCRFFDPGKWDPDRGKGELKANDRARASKRVVFRRWVEEYLPGHVGDEPADDVAVGMSREEVVEEAKRWFGVAGEYEERRATGLREIGRERMWTQIRKELDIEGESVGAVIRGVKREVFGEEGRLEAEMTTLQRAYAEDDYDAVVQWARENWKEIEETQRAIEREKSTKNLLAKLEKTKLAGKADSDSRLGKVKVEQAEDEGGQEEIKI